MSSMDDFTRLICVSSGSSSSSSSSSSSCILHACMWHV